MADVVSVDPEYNTADGLIPWMAIAVFASLSLFEAMTSKGFLEADSCTHYIYARYAFANPHYFTNVWGRPVCTAIYAGPAWLAGRLGVRAASLCIAVGLALVAREIAKGQGWSRPTLALVFTLAQPLVFLHSFSELTELPFAMLLAVGFWAYQRRMFWAMALVVGFTPLSRPEGFGFLLLAATALVAHRRPLWLITLALPLVAWDWAGWWLTGTIGPWWHWLITNWPYAEQSLYERGQLWHFATLMPAVTSPFVFPAFVLGVVLCLRGATLRQFVSNHRRRCEMLIAVIPLLIFLGHSLLYWRGKMASNGEVRYMLTVAAFWALLGSRGWSWVFEQLRWRRAMMWAGLAAIAPLLINFFYGVLPLRSQPDWIRAEQIASWYRDSDLSRRYPHLAAAHPGVFYTLDICPSDVTRTTEWKRSTLDAVPPGTMVIWDGCYGVYNADPLRSISEDELLKAGWTPLPTPWDRVRVDKWPWQLFVSQPVAGR